MGGSRSSSPPPAPPPPVPEPDPVDTEARAKEADNLAKRKGKRTGAASTLLAGDKRENKLGSY